MVEQAAAIQSNGLSSAFYPADLRCQTLMGFWPGEALVNDPAKMHEAVSTLSKCLCADTYGGVDAVRWARDAYNARQLMGFFQRSIWLRNLFCSVVKVSI